MSDDETRPETPEAKRLSFPVFALPEGASTEDLARALANAVMSIAGNLQYLREDAEARAAQESVNATAIRAHEKRIAAIDRELVAIRRDLAELRAAKG